MENIIDLENPDHAYFIGFVHADGTLSSYSRNRGKLSIEINASDVALLQKFQGLFPFYSSLSFRTRTTNFGFFNSACFSIHNMTFRKELEKYVPVGRKSEIIKVPDGISLADYFRGYIDGNGSIGITSKDIPFVNLTTNSDFIVTRQKTPTSIGGEMNGGFFVGVRCPYKK